MMNDIKMYIYNYEQAYYYMVECGIKPIERLGINKNTNTIYFVFNKAETTEAYSRWCNRNK